MSEVSLDVDGGNSIRVRLEPNNVQGRDMAGVPALYLLLELQLLPGTQQGGFECTLVRLAGKLLSQHLVEFGGFDVGPIAEVPSPGLFYRQLGALVAFDRRQVKRFEDARSGNDASFQIALSGLLWYPKLHNFGLTRCHSNLQVRVPKSDWVERVVSAWGLSKIKVVEIEFPSDAAGENFRASYMRVEEAERLFASGDYKLALTALRLSFEALAKSLGFERVGKEFFESMFTSCHPDKLEKAREALTNIYKFLHLGPHEQTAHADPNAQPVVTRQDARFALTLVHAIFEYITPRA